MAMISKSTLLHVRLPFSWFLMPVYMMSMVIAPSINWLNAIIVFIVMHIFLYTASNGINSYYDRDEESIGGLRTPPPVTNDLLWFSFLLDAAGVLLAFIVGWQFALGCFIYGIASKIYSWNKIRIKKYGVLGWLFVGFGQGTLTFLLITYSIAGWPDKGYFSRGETALPALAAGFFLLGVFPLTQVYQHAEDSRRNDMTISRMLGIKNTFYCAGLCMIVAITSFFYWFYCHIGQNMAYLFLYMIIPAVFYFVRWFLACRKSPLMADFSHTMWMNFLASSGVNLFGIFALFFR
jgi:1,4-dihydroxy-2-naphthoate octaprenyltransferase